MDNAFILPLPLLPDKGIVNRRNVGTHVSPPSRYLPAHHFSFRDRTAAPSYAAPESRDFIHLTPTSQSTGIESDGNFGQRWRRQNSSLVSEANRNGVDAAVEMLWSFSQDGMAVTQNFNQVVSLLAKKGRFEDGLALADEAGRLGLANIITFRPLMKRCCAMGDGRGAKRVWKVMSRWEVDGDMFLYAELMGALVRSQDLVSAQRVLTSLHDSGRRPHVVLYNTLMKGYARKANVRRGFEIFKRIEDAGIKPDETTFNTLLNICVRSKNADAMNRAIALMHEHNVKPGTPTFNTILKLYSRTGSFDHALKIFEEMKQTVDPSIVTYNTLIDGCAHRGDMERAAHFFSDMLSKGMSPDICTLTSLLKGFGRANDSVRAVELFEAMKEGGFKIEERTRYAVVDACLRTNDRENSRRLLKEMKDMDMRVRARTWSWMLESDVNAKEEDSALETLRMMYANGALIDASTKSILIDETREHGTTFLRLQRELKLARTVESSRE